MANKVKITWDDIELIRDDNEYDKCLKDDNYINELIQEEIKNIANLGYKIIETNIDYCIIECETLDNISFKVFPTNNISDNTTQKENIFSNDLNTKTAKAKIIVEYFTKNNIQVKQVKPDKNIITFNCPICRKDNEKMFIWTNSFHIKTHSKSDCDNETHHKQWNKWIKDLKKIWDESREKKQIVYNYNPEYLDNIIKTKFPKIIKQKSTYLLFRYDEAKKHYVEMIDNDIKSELTKLIQDNMFNDNNNLLNLKQVTEVKEYIKHTYNFPVRDFEKCSLYNCKNGVLDLKLKRLLPHSNKYFFNYCSEIEYNPLADTTKLYDFIKSVVTEKNPIELISKVLGFIHYQDEKLHKGFLFVGTKRGRNGKGTLVDLIREVIGDQRTVTMSLNMFQDSTFSEYSLKDKALYIEDDYKSEYIDSKIVGLLNRMISCVQTQVHQKNKAAINIKYSSIPLIQCNKIPRLKADDDGGFYDRWIQIHFNNEFANKMNEFLKSQLKSDKNVMSSLLNLLVDGYNLLLERKDQCIIGNFFKDDENNKDWRKANNPIIQFVEECCVLSSTYKIPSRDLYLYYKNEWNLGAPKIAENKFIKIICEEFNLEKKRNKINNKLVTMLHGVTCDDIIEVEEENTKNVF